MTNVSRMDKFKVLPGGRGSGTFWEKYQRLKISVTLAVKYNRSMLYGVLLGQDRILEYLKKDFPNVKFDKVESGIEINMDRKGKL